MDQLWRKLVKLFHPDRFAHEPEKQETYHKLTAAINHAKDHGDLATRVARLLHPQSYNPACRNLLTASIAVGSAALLAIAVIAQPLQTAHELLEHLVH